MSRPVTLDLCLADRAASGLIWAGYPRVPVTFRPSPLGWSWKPADLYVGIPAHPKLGVPKSGAIVAFGPMGVGLLVLRHYLVIGDNGTLLGERELLAERLTLSGGQMRELLKAAA